MELTLDRQSVILTVFSCPAAEIIGELSPYLKPAQFSGRLFIESPQLSYTGHHLSGNATAHWIRQAPPCLPFNHWAITSLTWSPTSKACMPY